MAIRAQRLGSVTRWTVDTYSEIASLTPRVGDLLYVASQRIEYHRATITTRDSASKTRWIPVDPMWGANDITMTPPFGTVDDEGVWTVDASDTFSEAELNETYDCLALIIATTGGDVAMTPVALATPPACLQIRCGYLGCTGANDATISMVGCGFAGGSGAAGAGDAGGAPTSTAYHGQFSLCSCGGGGGGAAAINAGGLGGGGAAGANLGQFWESPTAAPGAAGANTGGNGGNATSASFNLQPFEGTSIGGNIPAGAGGGGGGHSTGAGAGTGGAGGGVLFVDAAEVSVVGTFTLTVAGGAGTGTADADGAGGGGGGGLVRRRYRSSTGTVTLSAAGGAGGTGAGTGGDGGTGGTGIALDKRV
jgi:hypothetical protein